MTQHTCPRCHHQVEAQKRSPLWRVAFVGWIGVFVGIILAAGMIGPFIVGAIPFLALVGFAFGPMVSLIREEPTCPKCGRSLIAPPTERELEAARPRSAERAEPMRIAA